MTEVYRRIATPLSDIYARNVTTALGFWLAYAAKAEVDQNADPAVCREIYEQIAKDRYGAIIQRSSQDGATFYCEPGRSAHSINSSIVSIRVAFSVMIECGLRNGRNPFVKTRPAPINKAAQRRHRIENFSSYKRAPFTFYKVINKVQVPIYVTDGDRLVELMRKGGTLAKWPKRDSAVFEFHVSEGCRIFEVVEATLEGWSQCNFGNKFKVRNKGQGPLPRKIVHLTPLAVAAIYAYFTGDRQKHDRRAGDFAIWAAKRNATYTPEWYAAYLREKGISLSTEPLFLTDAGDPYTKETYTQVAWENARNKVKINATTHHVRHWYINKQLRLLEEVYGNDVITHFRKVEAFIDSMGWLDPFSLFYYDHEGRFLKVCRQYKLVPKLLELPKTTVGADLLKLTGLLVNT